MMKEIWIHKVNSFQTAEEFEDKYYLLKSPQERLSDIQLCRELYLKIKGKAYAGRKGLRRVLRIIKQA